MKTIMPKKVTKKSTKKAVGKKTGTAAKNSSAKSQILAVMLFALAIFLFCVAAIPGENVWSAIHGFYLGITGFWGYILSLILAGVALLIAFGKVNSGEDKVKIFEAFLLVWFASSLHYVIITASYSGEFWNHLTESYRLGSGGAGFFGSLLGYFLMMIFGKTASVATLVLLIAVFVMLVTGTTLAAIFRLIFKPVKSVRESTEQTYAEKLEKQPEKAENTEKRKAKFNVDVPLEDEYASRKKTEKDDFDKKKNKLIDTYHGLDTETGEISDSTAQKLMEAKARNDVFEPEDFDKDNKKEDNKTEQIDMSPSDSSESTENVGEKPEEIHDDKYVFPPISKLAPPAPVNDSTAEAELRATSETLVKTLRSFGIETRIINTSRGPSVTRYELQPSAGVKISKITSLADDIALNLATAGVRIEAPIPNKAAVGIEVPNKNVGIVRVREVIDSPAFKNAKSKLTVALGKDIAGDVAVADIAKMPHGLIAGATGSGKSVCINSFLISLLYEASPDDVKLLLIDPKVVELGIYNGIPHLLVPVVTDPRKASGALGWAVTEMEKRYKLFAENEVRNLEGYNRLAARREDLQKMPHIVIIIDELADLMMTAKREVEDNICRIAQKARAAGMHLIIATQRPSVDVVTGLIKANIPSRIAFSVSSSIDSRTILDTGGAEKLLGRGDMLFYPVGASKPHRIQGCFVSDSEVEEVVEYVKTSSKTNMYDENIMTEIERQAAKEKAETSGLPEDAVSDTDPLLDEAIRVVAEAGQASTSLLQRKLKLGYARAARVIDQMEERGVIGPYRGSKPREVLISPSELAAQTSQADDGE